MVVVKFGRASYGWLSKSDSCICRRVYLDSSRIGSLHQHHGHGWSEQDDIRVSVGCQKLMLQVSGSHEASAPLPLWFGAIHQWELTYSSQNAIILKCQSKRSAMQSISTYIIREPIVSQGINVLLCYWTMFSWIFVLSAADLSGRYIQQTS